jgi:hypothetical protein
LVWELPASMLLMVLPLVVMTVGPFLWGSCCCCFMAWGATARWQGRGGGTAEMGSRDATSNVDGQANTARHDSHDDRLLQASLSALLRVRQCHQWSNAQHWSMHSSWPWTNNNISTVCNKARQQDCYHCGWVLSHNRKSQHSPAHLPEGLCLFEEVQGVTLKVRVRQHTPVRGREQG